MPTTDPAAHVCGELAAGPAGLKALAAKLGRRVRHLSAGVGDAALHTAQTGSSRAGLSCSSAARALLVAMVAGLAFADAVVLKAQSRRVEPAEVRCRSVLGVGVDTDRIYCDVLIGNEIADGIIVVIPAHRGAATVTFTLYGRHTFSEDEVARGRGYVEYLASTAVATTETVLARPVVLAEFRTEADLVDRVSGGAGPGGVKAVAPVGGEGIRITVPEGVTEISIVGLELQVHRVDGEESFSSTGRPIAVISDVQVEYRAR